MSYVIKLKKSKAVVHSLKNYATDRSTLICVTPVMSESKLARKNEKIRGISSCFIRMKQTMSGRIKAGLFAGAISGIALGFLLKAIEAITGKLVYTLLLNVDFIPIIGQINWPEWIEFVFHLFISLIIGVIYSIGSSRYFSKQRKAQAILAYILTLPTVFLYFPLTYLAIKPTPGLWDFTAITYWTLGHVIYAAILFGTYTSKHTFD